MCLDAHKSNPATHFLQLVKFRRALAFSIDFAIVLTLPFSAHRTMIWDFPFYRIEFWENQA
jgi:hypothetical protein